MTSPGAKQNPDKEVFTFDGRSLSRAEYLGKDGGGPFADQYLSCRSCGQEIHKFAIRCLHCGASVREIGKIETAARGSAGKGIGFVVGILGLAMLAMVMGQRGATGGYSLGVAIPLAAGGFLLGVNGLLGLLYFRSFALVTFLRGMSGFILGGVSLILAAVLFILLI